MKQIAAAVLFCLALLPIPGLANDSTAILRAGDLQLTFNPDIAMLAEELTISAREISVSYRFRNASRRDIETLVAFPLPVIQVGEDTQYDVPQADAENFLDFRLLVDGQPVMPKLELRAHRFGVDQTKLLAELGLPLLPFGDLYARLEKLGKGAKQRLEHAGLADWHTSFGAGNTPLPNPHWRVRAAFYWQQRFPAGETVAISHRYRPVAGMSFFGEHVLSNAGLQRDYCMDDAFLRAARGLIERGEQAMVRELHYVLTTANNWRGTIGEFRLVIDKGKPRNLVSLCRDGIKKTGPTTFEYRSKEFVPQNDLKVLIIEPGSGAQAG